MYKLFISQIMSFLSYLKSHFHTQDQIIWVFLYVIFQECCNFAFYVWIHDPFWVNFCDECKVCVWVNFFFSMWMPVPAPFVENTVLVALCPFCSFAKTSICRYLCGSVSRLRSIHVFSVLSLVSPCLDYCSSMVSLDIM